MALNNPTSKIMGYPDWHTTSFEDFDEWVRILNKEVRTKNLVFRGQRKNWELLPSLCRNGPRNKILENEKKSLQFLTRKGEPCLHLPPSNDWDWLVVAQHHGLPTRLLDWSSDPHIALWFALEQSHKNGSNPEVWALSPTSEDFIEDLENTRPFQGTRTKIFETNFSIPRVRAQKGCFALFKDAENFPKGFVPLERDIHLRKRLVRIRIANFASKSIFQTLESKGLTKQKMYPDIDLVINEIKKEIYNQAEPYNKPDW